MKLWQLNDRGADKKDYLYQPRLFRSGYREAGKRSGRTGTTFVAGMLADVLLSLVSLLLYPKTVMALLRMVVQVIHIVGNKS